MIKFCGESSQATTKAGDTSLGENLTFEFNNYIDKSFAGPNHLGKLVLNYEQHPNIINYIVYTTLYI
ncbi:hypothetical protein [uncultured Planktosalinus sp.]|uniref:hypothetical protein n=1 Tax=uncultured Planktosalinus sp. TaxID=1810935 RepID=UPI0030DB7369